MIYLGAFLFYIAWYWVYRNRFDPDYISPQQYEVIPIVPDYNWPSGKKKSQTEMNQFDFSFVGVAGFEPTTSSSRTTRATKLRYTPFLKIRFRYLEMLSFVLKAEFLIAVQI